MIGSNATLKQETFDLDLFNKVLLWGTGLDQSGHFALTACIINKGLDAALESYRLRLCS